MARSTGPRHGEPAADRYQRDHARRVAKRARRSSIHAVLTLLLFAPVFLVFEVWQLIVSERYLGIKQIARAADPRTLGLGEVTAFVWTIALVGYWLWMLLLLFASTGRVHGLGLILVSGIGFILRRGAPLKWVLVILTFEGAIRVGLLFSMCAIVWRSL